MKYQVNLYHKTLQILAAIATFQSIYLTHGCIYQEHCNVLIKGN